MLPHMGKHDDDQDRAPSTTRYQPTRESAAAWRGFTPAIVAEAPGKPKGRDEARTALFISITPLTPPYGEPCGPEGSTSGAQSLTHRLGPLPGHG